MSIGWSIAVRSIATPSVNKASFTYTGSAQGPAFTYDSNYVTISGDSTAKTNAGSYAASFTLKSRQTPSGRITPWR